MASDLLKITGLWESKDRNGQTYLSGTLGGLRVHIFKNKFKEGNKPDYNLYFSKREERDERTEQTAQRPLIDGPLDGGDDIPF